MSLIDFMTATLARATAPLFLFCMLVTSSYSTASQPVADAQESLSVPTAKLLPTELLQGSNFKLAPTTTVYRGVALYQVDTEFGQSTVVGREGLLQRIDELNAIERLREMKGSEVYKEALKNSASAPVDTVKNLADAPVETIKGIGRGLGGFLADVGYAIVSDDPNQEHVAKTATGFAAAKRSLAFGLGVSPYSSFQPLQDELSEVAWTAVGGGLTVSLGFKAIGGATGTALSATGSAEAMRGLVRDHSPRELQNINYDKLLAMGVEKDLAEAMLDNFNYDPEEETRLIGALAAMDGVAGRHLFIERAALQDQPYNARLMREWAELFAGFHIKVEKVKAIVMAQTAPLFVRQDGTASGVFPADYLVPDPTFEKRNRASLAAIRAQGLTPGEVWITGRIDPRAKPLVKEIGWQNVHGDAAEKLAPSGQQGM